VCVCACVERERDQKQIYIQDTTESPMLAADIALHFSVQEELQE